jgi:hypothetical protein
MNGDRDVVAALRIPAGEKVSTERVVLKAVNNVKNNAPELLDGV